MDPSTDLSTDLQVETAHLTLQIMLDQVTETTVTPTTMTHTIDRDTTETTIEIGDTASGRYNDQICLKIETQINELDDSFQDCDINAMNTRSTNRSSVMCSNCLPMLP